LNVLSFASFEIYCVTASQIKRVLEVKGKDIQNHLEQYLNDLEGEVISILPAIKKGSLTQIYGVTEKVDYLLKWR